MSEGTRDLCYMTFDAAASNKAPRRLSLDSSRWRIPFTFHPPSEIPDEPIPVEAHDDGNASGSQRDVDGLEIETNRGLVLSDSRSVLLDDLLSMQASNGTLEVVSASASTKNLLNLEHWSDLSNVMPQDCSNETLDLTGPKSTGELILAALEYEVKIVNSKRIQYSEIIGCGANMKVYKGSVNGRVCALKQVRSLLSGTEASPEPPQAALASLEMEIRVMSDMFLRGHENIAKLQAFTWDISQHGELVPVLIMDLAAPECPTLDAFMQHVDVRAYTSKAHLISDLICGLAAIHEEKIIHGDLKPENILLFDRKSDDAHNATMRLTAKITDFGFCEDIHPEKASSSSIAAGGTEYWNAPECLLGAPDELKPFVRRTQRDMYSCGLIIWYILSNTLPFGPSSGRDWEMCRSVVRQAKISGKVVERYASWLDDNLHMRFDLSAKEDLEKFEAELEDELSPLQISSRMIVQKLRTDNLFASQVMFDEILFRHEGKAAWFLKDAHSGELMQCSGYLPVMVPVVILNMLQPAPTRLPASAALPMCKLYPNRKPAKIYEVYKSMSTNRKDHDGRQGWDEFTPRFRGTLASARKLQTLSSEMHSSLLKELHSNADGSVPSLRAILMLFTVYGQGYGIAKDLLLAQKYILKALELTKNTDLGDKLGSYFIIGYYCQKWHETAPLEQQQELKWALQMFSHEIRSPLKTQAPRMIRVPTLSRESFESRLADALSSLEWKLQSRFFRTASSAYIQHQMVKESNRTDPLLRKPETGNGVSEVRGAWVHTLLSDDPVSFEVLQESGALPTELRLFNEDMDSVLYMLAGTTQMSKEQSHMAFLRGIIQHEKSKNNLVRICAEHGLVRLLKILVEKHNIKIDKKLDSGRNAIQEVLEQGRIDRAFSVLACGANLTAVAEKDFIRHISGDGHFGAIDFWAQLREFHEQLLETRDANFLLFDHYRAIYQLFSDNDNMDLDAQAYETHGVPVQPASPIYFSIAENNWQTFLALLRYGVNPSKPVMGTFNALQSSVVMIRPFFVATLLGPEYEHILKTSLSGTPSLYHLVALGEEYFKQDKMWVYFDEVEIKNDPEAAYHDQENNQRIVLELLSRNLSLEIDDRDKYGMTPFLLAVAQNNAPAAAWFEGHGANIKARALDGCTALHLSIASGSEQMTAYVLGIAKDLLEVQDNLGQTALHFAVSQPDTRILKHILDLQPKLESVDRLGRNPFLVSLDHGQHSAFVMYAQVLCKALGQDKLTQLLGAQDKSGRTCFHALAAISDVGLDHIFEVLNFHNLDLFDKDEDNSVAIWTPGHLALCRNSEYLDDLITARSINAKGYQGLTCLHLVSLLPNRDPRHNFILKRTDPNIMDDFGRYPADLHHSTKEKHPETLLVDAMMFLFTEKLLLEAQEMVPISYIHRPIVAGIGQSKTIFPKTYLLEFKELHVDEAHTTSDTLEAGRRLVQQLFPAVPPKVPPTQRSRMPNRAMRFLSAMKWLP